MAITYIETDGGKLAVEVEGAGPLVVCSPAMGDTRDAFGPLATRLVAAGYRVARIDLRGHGDSTATFRRYGDEAAAEDFLAVVKQLGGPAVLAGASMSAAAGVIAAGRQPDQVAGFISLGGFVRPPGPAFMQYVFRMFLLWPWGPAFWRYNSANFWPGLGSEAARARAVSKVELLTRPKRWSAFQATVAGAGHDMVAPWLLRVKEVPALVVVGDLDPDWSDPVAEGKWVASNFTDAEVLTVTGAGHAPMFEKPEVVAPAVIRFLERIDFKKSA